VRRSIRLKPNRLYRCALAASLLAPTTGAWRDEHISRAGIRLPPFSRNFPLKPTLRRWRDSERRDSDYETRLEQLRRSRSDGLRRAGVVQASGCPENRLDFPSCVSYIISRILQKERRTWAEFGGKENIGITTSRLCMSGTIRCCGLR